MEPLYEHRLLLRLQKLFSPTFQTVLNPRVTHERTGRNLSPDMIVCAPDGRYYAFELKDDTAKNYDENQLIKQAVDYSHSKYNGNYISCCFIVKKTDFSYREFEFSDRESDLLESNKSNIKNLIGKFMVGWTRFAKKSNDFSVGFYLYQRPIFSIKQAGKTIEYNPQNLVSDVVGTKPKSNRLHSVPQKQVDVSTHSGYYQSIRPALCDELIMQAKGEISTTNRALAAKHGCSEATVRNVRRTITTKTH